MEQKVGAWEDLRRVTGLFLMEHGSGGGGGGDGRDKALSAGQQCMLLFN